MGLRRLVQNFKLCIGFRPNWAWNVRGTPIFIGFVAIHNLREIVYLNHYSFRRLNFQSTE
jgi:hypothetical protein